MIVYGFGEQKTPRAFVTACDKFIYTEILVTEDEHGGTPSTPSRTKKTAKELLADAKFVSLLRTAVKSCADDEGWSHLAIVGSHIANHAPDFDPRNYGYPKLGQLVVATELFEIQERTSKSGHAQKYIRDSQVKKASS
jgi:uncharacterized LabA/DUF88 family protein